MPKTLNPQNTFPTSIPNFPISGNNEPIAIEPLENAIQAVLNRSENLHVRLSEAETQGVKRVRMVASLAALSAATGFNNGDVCDVEGYGRYRLYNPSSLPADGLWVLNAAGGGRWVHTLRDMRGIGNGLATLDSSQRLAQDVRDNSIQTQHIANQAVTAAKLAPGSVVGHLGYTPVNKAGDTMTGNLIVNGSVTSGTLTPGISGGFAGHIDGSGPIKFSNGGAAQEIYVRKVRASADWATNDANDPGDGGGFFRGRLFVQNNSGWNGAPTIALAIGDNDTGLHWGGDGIINAYANNQEVFGWNQSLVVFYTGKQVIVLDSLSVFGEISGRYNHTNRFVLQTSPNGITVPANSGAIHSSTLVFIPSNKIVYLKRVRWFLASQLRPQISTSAGFAWTGSSEGNDIAMDFALSSAAHSNSLIVISLVVLNITQYNITVPSSGIWAELEIR